MEDGMEFNEALEDAREKGYTEADESFDIDGVDAAHKLIILTANAFGKFPEYFPTPPNTKIKKLYNVST